MCLPIVILGIVSLIKAQKIRTFICGILLCLLPFPLWVLAGINVDTYGIIIVWVVTIPSYLLLLVLGLVQIIKIIKNNYRKI